MSRSVGEQGGDRLGSSPELVKAVGRLWSNMVTAGGDDAEVEYGLIPELPFDAVLARLDRAESLREAARCVPRLVDLMVDHALTVDEAAVVVDRLTLGPWTDRQREVVVHVLEAWWLQALRREPGEHHPDFPPAVVLGLVAGIGDRMSRWLAVWIDELDGPGAQHLADTVLDGLDGPSWRGKDDEAQQVLGWARTEAVVNGVALVGAVHLEPELTSRLLDRLLKLDEPPPGQIWLEPGMAGWPFGVSP